MNGFGVLLGSAGALFVGGCVAVSLSLSGCGSDDDPSGPGTSLDVPLDGGPAGSTDGGIDPSTDLPPSSGNDGGTPVDGACGGTEVKASARDANLLLVLDKSGSMLQKPNGFDAKKWDALRTALRAALAPVQQRIGLGLMMYPHDPAAPIGSNCTGANCCMVPSGEAAVNVAIAPGMQSLDPILNAIDTAAPGGATPTSKALEQAWVYFTTGAGKELNGDKFVILATDGGPNCNTALGCGAETCTTNIDGNCTTGGNCCDPTRSTISCLDAGSVTEKLEALKGAGVKTFVVGIPGTEAYATYLDRFAEAGGFVDSGGTSKYFAVAASGGVAGLTDVFAKITGELITSCTLALESAPPNADEVNVLVDGTAVPQGGADGWSLEGTTVVLKGRSCEEVKTKGAKVITVTFGCPTIR